MKNRRPPAPVVPAQVDVAETKQALADILKDLEALWLDQNPEDMRILFSILRDLRPELTAWCKGR